MRLAGPNGIAMLAAALIIWHLQLGCSWDKLKRWGWMVVEVQNIMEVLLKDVPAWIPVTVLLLCDP
jgi:hypothetical protein